MKHRSKRRRADVIVSASELAQMGRCEQLVLFEHRQGQRRLPHQEAARRHGLAAHKRFEQEGLSIRSAGLRRAGRLLCRQSALR
jgi:protein-arginine kinase